MGLPAILALVLTSCGGGSSAQTRIAGVDLSPAAAREAGPFKAWSLTADGSSAIWPQQIDLAFQEQDGYLELSLGSQELPDDIYIAVSFDWQQLSFDSMILTDEVQRQYVSLAVAHHEPGMLYVGLARKGDERQGQAPNGQAATLRFARGRAPGYRAVSTVNADPASESLLTVDSAVGLAATLAFVERNIGDYNNNSQVEIADITPVGLHYGKLVADAPVPAELELVDGDGNGEINAADLVAIGRNFGTQIDGYSLFRTDPPVTGGAPLLDLPRTAVYSNASPTERKQRLRYSADVELELGNNTFYVAAYSAAEDPPELGLPSNSVDITGSPLNDAPYWLTTTGVATATPTNTGIRLAFGAAEDPEGGTVEYVLRYTRGFEAMFGPTTTELVLPAPSGDPPYSYLFESDERGTRFNFNLRARDPEGNSTSNTNVVSASVPALDIPADPWPGPFGSVQRTRTNMDSQFEEPLEPLWDVQHPISLWVDEYPWEFTPVASAEGWVGAFDGNDGGAFRRYSTADGALLGEHQFTGMIITSGPALSGDLLAVGTTGGVAVVDLSTGNDPVKYEMGGMVADAPLLLGDYVFCCDTRGQTYALVARTGEEVWRHQLPGADYYSIAPATDGMYLYTASLAGEVNKFDLLTGEVVATGAAGAQPIGGSIAVSTSRNSLFIATRDTLATPQDMLVELALDDLAITRGFPQINADAYSVSGPCILEYADPPLAVLCYNEDPNDANIGHIAAFNLDTGALVWDTPLEPFNWPQWIVASGNRIIAGRYSFDFQGSLRQEFITDPLEGETGHALTEDGLFTVTYDGIYRWKLADEDLPPHWVDDEGITDLESGQYSVTPHWGQAVNDHRMPVYYAVFISEGPPPGFDPPHFGTTVLHSIPPGGEGVFGGEEQHQYLVDSLDNGTRYYVGVRAYERPWYDNPRFDDNTNWLAVTPPWLREVLVAGVDVPAGPGGGIHFMKGITDPSGEMHLVYTDNQAGQPAHVWGTTGSWQSESSDLSQYVTPAFELTWDSGLVAGWADSLNIGLLKRNDTDSWLRGVIPGTETTLNPQMSFAIDGDIFAAYTEHILGTLPPVLETHYWFVESVGGEWQPPVAIDSDNESGRDLHLVLGTGGDPWVAFQRGENYATNRITASQGLAMYARPDGGGGFTLETVDSGDNVPDSDCGKRMRQALGSDGNPRLAYLDLNSSEIEPTGQLKFARYDGAEWQVETVLTFDLAFQPGGAQHTYGELSLHLLNDDTPIIGFGARLTYSGSSQIPHQVEPQLWIKDGPDWRRETIWDYELMYPVDREPVVLLETPDNVLHMFYAMSDAETQTEADQLVHMWRPPDELP